MSESGRVFKRSRGLIPLFGFVLRLVPDDIERGFSAHQQFESFISSLSGLVVAGLLVIVIFVIRKLLFLVIFRCLTRLRSMKGHANVVIVAFHIIRHHHEVLGLLMTPLEAAEVVMHPGKQLVACPWISRLPLVPLIRPLT